MIMRDFLDANVTKNEVLHNQLGPNFNFEDYINVGANEATIYVQDYNFSYGIIESETQNPSKE